MPDLTLKMFLEDYPEVISVSGDVDKIQYQNLSTDSRTLQKGQFFIPLKGENFDGHEFIRDVIKKNVGGVVVESSWYSKQDHHKIFEKTPCIIVDNTLNFMQKLSNWHRSHFNIPIIGITGSNGKTTIRKMITEILSDKFAVLSNVGNQNNHIGVPLTLLKLQSSNEVAVIEIGTNHPGEIALLTELVNPSFGIITNIGKGHIGFFGSLNAIYKEKTALFDNMRNGSVIFLNMDDTYLKKYETSLRTIRIGTSDKFDYWGKIISIDEFGAVKFDMNNLTEIQLKVPGVHHFHNALIAAAVGLQFDISISEIKETLENFEPVNQRMQVYKVNGVWIINDAYNANPDSSRSAIEYLAELSSIKGRKIIAFGDMLELGDFGEQEHYSLGKFISNKSIDMIFLFGPLAKSIKKGIAENNSFAGETYWYGTHQEITEHLRKILAPNDALLIKGSRGMKMENILNNLFNQN